MGCTAVFHPGGHVLRAPRSAAARCGLLTQQQRAAWQYEERIGGGGSVLGAVSRGQGLEGPPGTGDGQCGAELLAG